MAKNPEKKEIKEMTPSLLESVDINPILDEIMAREGLASRFEARRWLIEARDAHKRQKLTEGRKTKLVVSNAGSGFRRRISLDNPFRKLVSDQVTTLPPEKRVSMEPVSPALLPEIPQKRGFAAMLEEIKGNKTPHKSKSEKQKATERRSRQRGGDSEIHREHSRNKVSTQGRPKLLKPSPGTDSRLVYEVLVKNNWNRRNSLSELKAHPKFNRFETEYKRDKAIGAQLSMVINRYNPPDKPKLDGSAES